MELGGVACWPRTSAGLVGRQPFVLPLGDSALPFMPRNVSSQQQYLSCRRNRLSMAAQTAAAEQQSQTTAAETMPLASRRLAQRPEVDQGHQEPSAVATDSSVHQPDASSSSPQVPPQIEAPVLRCGPGHDDAQSSAATDGEPSVPRTEAAVGPARPAAATPELVVVGVIRQPHGVRGEMKVQPLTDFPEDRLATPGVRWLQPPDTAMTRRQAAAPVRTELEWGRPSISRGNEIWLVKLAGVDSPEDADALRGHALLVRADERPPLEDADEFYVQDLIGMAVTMKVSGARLGTVIDVYDGTGAHDILRVLLTQGSDADLDHKKTALIPFVKEIVPVVDKQRQVLEITPPKGLIEATTTAMKSRRQRQKLVKGAERT